MNRFLRHISVRFWLVTLMALPLSFWLLPRFLPVFPTAPPLAVVVGIFAVLGAMLGLGLDFTGRYRIKGLIREGELWERAGIQNRAEKKYLQAVRVFDSVWISPWGARRLAPALIKVMARFYLTCGSAHPGFRIAAARYLIANPGDETLAVLWLRQLRKQGKADTLAQSVLTALADRYFADPKLSLQLTGPFLDLGRVDFSARRLYRNFLDFTDEDSPGSGTGENGTSREDYQARIRELMGNPEEEELSGTIVAEPSRRRTLLGRTLGDRLKGRHPVRSEIPIRNGSQPKMSRQYLRQIGRLPVRGIQILSPVARGGANAGFSMVTWLLAAVKRGFAFLRDHLRQKEKAGFYIRALFSGLLGLWLMFFFWNTLSHMLKSGSPEPPAQKIDVSIPKPFTIQVAAYLKQSHADRYVAVLEKKGIEATIKKTGGGGKTWYLVRVSEFPDKKSAADFGNRLKAEKVINDFFVSNK